MGSIGCEDFYLIDQWPGEVMWNKPAPTGGFDSTAAGNRSTTAVHVPGTKMIGYQDATVGAGGSNVANRGYYRMLYAQYLDYTSADDISASAVVILACSSAKARGGVAFTKDVSGGNEFSETGPAGVTCTSIGASQYGWIWVGGICPNYDLTQLDVTGFLTDGNVVAGCAMTSINSHVDGTEGALFSGPADDGTYTLLVCGYAMVDDT